MSWRGWGERLYSTASIPIFSSVSASKYLDGILKASNNLNDPLAFLRPYCIQEHEVFYHPNSIRPLCGGHPGRSHCSSVSRKSSRISLRPPCSVHILRRYRCRIQDIRPAWRPPIQHEYVSSLSDSGTRFQCYLYLKTPLPISCPYSLLSIVALIWFILQTTPLALAKSAAQVVIVIGSAILTLIPRSRLGRPLLWARLSCNHLGFAGLRHQLNFEVCYHLMKNPVPNFWKNLLGPGRGRGGGTASNPQKSTQLEKI